MTETTETSNGYDYGAWVVARLLTDMPVDDDIAGLPEPWSEIAQRVAKANGQSRTDMFYQTVKDRPDAKNLEQAVFRVDPTEPAPGRQEPAGYCTMADLRKFFGSIKWAWEWWVPIGHVTMIAGDTGIGKSWLAAAYIGALTGYMPWPDGTPAVTGRRVLLLETESFRGPWAERLEILGIPDEMVITPSDDPTFVPDLLRDEKLILQVAREQNCGAMLVDSLSGGHNLDENSQEMKRLLGTLAHWGASLVVPVLTVHHTRKRASHESSKITLDRVRGSSTITQFCRTVVGLWQPEEGFGKPVRADMIKTNFKPQPSFGFTLSDNGIDFGQAPEPAKEITAVDRAVEFLHIELRQRPQPYSELLPKAEAQGISKDSLYRARHRLAIVTVDGLWSLPYEIE